LSSHVFPYTTLFRASDFNFAETDRAASKMVQQPARGCDDDLRTILQRTNLPTHMLAAVYCKRANAFEFSKTVYFRSHLNRKLSRSEEHTSELQSRFD